eukprot:CAMPEP_0179106928 /NCGR_PEP_ID=MMETSP0796-20121207/49744_1 /TAXON_ID=73915 /ORGANISM="Pyrodinium bahamense, Strain pbaha01" /LENGTH=272 /DNA_ID=CAMNT_0020804977 /DNA_START=41 /DNA_END=860 /DNA_ORIENTATION=-
MVTVRLLCSGIMLALLEHSVAGSSDSEPIPSMVFDSDDQCLASADASKCGLELLQRRGRQLTDSVPLNEFTMAHRAKAGSSTDSLGEGANVAEQYALAQASVGCTEERGNCYYTKSCCSTSWHPLTCYLKISHVAVCRPTGNCVPGIHNDEPPEWQQPWACTVWGSDPAAPPVPGAAGAAASGTGAVASGAGAAAAAVVCATGAVPPRTVTAVVDLHSAERQLLLHQVVLPDVLPCHVLHEERARSCLPKDGHLRPGHQLQRTARVAAALEL